MTENQTPETSPARPAPSTASDATAVIPVQASAPQSTSTSPQPTSTMPAPAPAPAQPSSATPPARPASGGSGARWWIAGGVAAGVVLAVGLTQVIDAMTEEERPYVVQSVPQAPAAASDPSAPSDPSDQVGPETDRAGVDGSGQTEPSTTPQASADASGSTAAAPAAPAATDLVHVDDEVFLDRRSLDTLEARAIEAAGGAGTVVDIDADPEDRRGHVYEVEVRRADGTEVDVTLDAELTVVKIEDDGRD